MRTRSTGCLAAACILLVVATTPDLYAQQGEAEAEKAVLARIQEIQLAAQSRDPDKVFSYVLVNDTGALAQNGELLLTREQALESTRAGFEGVTEVTYRLDEQHVTFLSPTVALVTGTGVVSGTTGDGGIFSTRFAQSVVLKLTDGEWMVFHAHRSFPPRR